MMHNQFYKENVKQLDSFQMECFSRSINMFLDKSFKKKFEKERSEVAIKLYSLVVILTYRIIICVCVFFGNRKVPFFLFQTLLNLQIEFASSIKSLDPNFPKLKINLRMYRRQREYKELSPNTSETPISMISHSYQGKTLMRKRTARHCASEFELKVKTYIMDFEA